MPTKTKELSTSANVGAEGIAQAALRVFYLHGYHGTSVRDIAKAAKVTVAALYYHFPGKQNVLAFLMLRAMQSIIDDAEQALADAKPDPRSQIDAVVRSHVRYHTARQAEAFVGNTELRSLEPANKREVIALRDQYEDMVESIVRRGVRAGVFRPPHQKEAVRAILAMCTAVSSWYKEDGSLTPDQVAGRYSDLTIRILGAGDASANGGRRKQDRR
jgi:AcrR family transcriptional regulator